MEIEMTVKTIEQNLLKLSPIKRIRIVETSLASLDRPDPEIERAWVAESEKRFKAFKNGKVKAISLEDFQKHIRR